MIRTQVTVTFEIYGDETSMDRRIFVKNLNGVQITSVSDDDSQSYRTTAGKTVFHIGQESHVVTTDEDWTTIFDTIEEDGHLSRR